MTLFLLPDNEMNFSVEPDHSGCLILTAECHKDESGRKISFSIRLDQIPPTCSSRKELVKFIDNYVRGRKTNGLLVPRDEYKFHLGFAPETGQILLFSEMMIRDGYVQSDRILLSDLPEDARTVKGLENTLVSRNKGQASGIFRSENV